MKQRFFVIVFSLSLAACAQQVSMPDDRYALAMVNYRQHLGSSLHWSKVLNTLGTPDTVRSGYGLQERYVQLRARTEQRAGYKVALGSAASQALLGASEPIIGVLFANDLLRSGSRVDQRQGMVLAVEADLLATVATEKINSARTIEEVAEHIESLNAYIELPDLPFPFATHIAPSFAATNSGANLGIVGSRIQVSASAEFIEQLANMQVVLSAESPGGRVQQIAMAPGNALMSHPYNAVLFLLKKLSSQGRALKSGDVISLGAYSKPTPVASLMSGEGLAVSIHYQGLLDHKTGSSASATVYFD